MTDDRQLEPTSSTPQAATAHLIAGALSHIADGTACLWVADSAEPPYSGATTPASLAAIEWVTRTPTSLLNEPWQKRYALAIVHVPADLSTNQALHLLASLRDLHAKQVLAFIPVDALNWQAADLLALGMQRHARFEQSEGDNEQLLIEAWSFDIKTYKAVPDWLNPRFWANPEKWNLFRW